jgi:hypothetical protein
MPIIKQTIGEEKTSTDINREKEIIRQAKINAATQFAGQRARPSVSQTPSLEREPAILSVKKEIESNDSKITKGIRRWSFGFVKTESRKMMEKLRADDIVKKSGDSPYPGSLGRRFARTLKRKE